MKRRKPIRAKTPRFIAFAEELNEMRPLVVARAHGLCELCGVKAGDVVHHKLRRSQGGTNKLSNLMLLCNQDHEWVHSHPAESYKQGYLRKRTYSGMFVAEQGRK